MKYIVALAALLLPLAAHAADPGVSSNLVINKSSVAGATATDAFNALGTLTLPCTSTVKGLVPLPPNDPSKYLRGDCTFVSALTPASVAAAGTVTGSNLSGTNTGDVTLTAVGAVPSANGASLAGQALTLQPADATHPGLLTTGAQTFAGTKTFSSAISGSVTGTSANVTGVVATTNGGTGQATVSAGFNALSPLTTLGDLLYGAAAGAGTRLPGNITAAKQWLSQTGTGAVSAAPLWSSIASGDVSGLAPSATTDTTNANNISSGTLAAARMPLGITGVPSAGQVLAGNAGGTAYAPVSVSGDGALSSAGALVVTKTNGVALGTLATQNAGAVAITGGAIDNTTIGATTRAPGYHSVLGVGTNAPTALEHILGSGNIPAWGSTGALLRVQTNVITDSTSTGTVASQFGSIFQNGTINSTSPTTYTNNSTLNVGGAPVPGANAAMTNSTALSITGASVAGGGGVTNGYGLQVAAPVGAANNYAATFNGGNVGIGTAAPLTGLLHLVGTASDAANGSVIFGAGTAASTTNAQYGLRMQLSAAPASASNVSYAAVAGAPSSSSTNVGSAALVGLQGSPAFGGSGSLATAIGQYSVVQNTSTGTINNAWGNRIGTPSNASGTLTNTTGVRIENQTVGVQTQTPRAIDQLGAGDLNIFAGNVGLKGPIAPTAYLNIGAGTAAAGTAPFKFTPVASALLATPESGALEVDSSGNPYYTDTTPTRRRIVGTTGSSNDLSTILASPPAIGGTAPGSGAFTTLTSNGNTQLGGQITMFGVAPDTQSWFRMSGNLPANIAGTVSVGMFIDGNHPATATSLQSGIDARVRQQAAGSATTAAAVDTYRAETPILGTNWTVTTANGLHVITQGTTGGSVANGVLIDDQTTATTGRGLRSVVSAGATKWNLYADGTAKNYLAGQTSIGTAAVPSGLLNLGAGTTTVPAEVLTTGVLTTTALAGAREYDGTRYWLTNSTPTRGSILLSTSATADFPTLNQSTTGSAATLTTPRAINGVNFDGSAAITVTADANTLTNTTLASNVVSSSLTSVGTLGALTVTAPIAGSVTGTSANVTGTVAIGNGGTGQTTASAAFNALSPITTLGDLLYGAAAGADTRLAGNITSAKQFLTQTGTGAVSAAPAWGAIAAADLPVATTGAFGAVKPDGTTITVSSGVISAVSSGGTVTTTGTPTTGSLTQFSGATAIANADLTGDVTTSGTLAATIGSNKVTNPKLATMAAHTYKGNNTAATANAADVTNTQLTADLNPFTTALQGVVPGSGGGTVNFLRADGAWATPPAGTGTVTSVALTAPSVFSVSGTPVTTAGTLGITFATGQTANQFLATPNGASGAVGLRAIVAADIPTLNQNTTGTASNVTGVVGIANGGTGQATQQAAINALSGTQSAGKYLRSDGTNATLASIVAGDVPTLNQSTTGSAATLTTPRAINGVNFDGSAAITVTAAAGTLTGTTLAAGVVSSSLTSVGTLTNLTVTNPIAGSVTGSAASFTGTLAGDVTGTQAATVVGKINGVALSGLATGVLKNTTATGVPSIATSGTDYSAGTSALATGILKSTTTTGALTIAVAGDFPTLNQNTTGSAATVTTNANLTGPITSVGNATSIASQTGTGTKFVVDTSPTLVTPTIGVATATSVNKVAITAPATSATLTIANGATLNATASATVSGTNTGDQTITLTGDATGSGTGSFATTVGKINGTSLAGLATGILKNTTTTGVPSIAVAGDFPTLNQDTTGKSATSDALNSATTAVNVSAATAPSAGQVLTATDGTHATWQAPAVPFSYGGDGSDGAVLMDGTNTFAAFTTKSGNTYTLTRDVLALTLTVNNGITLVVAGFRIFASVSVTNNTGGTISAVGAAGATGSVSGAGGVGAVNGYTSGGTNGGAGAVTGNPGVNGTKNSIGGAGGAGGGAAGGAGGTIIALSAAQGAINILPIAVLLYVLNTPGTAPSIFAGGSGGGGGGTSFTGGGGGGGGGIIGIYTPTLINNGTITAAGGAGGQGGGPSRSGGGGGGGGAVVLVTQFTITGSGAITAAGGAGGITGGGSGVAGTNGVSGSVIQLLAT